MTADLVLPSDRLAAQRADQISQATAVEQARAVAEVAAAVRVAQDNPRDLDKARAQMRDACSYLALAERAFYRVTNRGSGPSVHLARELARCFGNIQHGVIELRRDDDEGISEVQAFAWDLENNTRSVRSFIVPHERMAGGKRKPLVDLTDITLNNNNVGARAVRETIWHVLPVGFRLEAERLCDETLQRGTGDPIEVRRAQAVALFGKGGITEAQLVAKIGRPVDSWDEEDLAGLAVLFQSLKVGEVTKSDEFPDAPVTVADLAGPTPIDVDPTVEPGFGGPQ